MKTLLVLVPFVFLLAGCGSGGGDNVNAETDRAAKSVPKSAAELPSGMPDQARKGAEAAMGQMSAREAEGARAAEAMRKAGANR